MKLNKFIIIILLIVVLITTTYKKKGVKLTRIRSDIDNRLYTVRDEDTKQRSSNMLGRIRNNLLSLSKYMVENKDKYKKMAPYIDRLSDRIEGVIISESDGSSKYTSYSINKGEELVFCLRSKYQKNKLHHLNLVMYVALHEISHIACPENGHTPLFNEIFSFFTEVSIKIGLYKKIEFNNNSREYCGLLITDSIV